jgi:hypothetical protein
VVLGLCYLTRWEDRYQDAVRLAGAAASLRERVGGRAPLDFLAGFLGDPEAEARARLPEDAARRAFQEGRSMSVDAALALAARQDATTDDAAGSASAPPQPPARRDGGSAPGGHARRTWGTLPL